MAKVVNMSINVDGVILNNWDCGISHSYKEYRLAAVYVKGTWAYGVTLVGSGEPLATLTISSSLSQRQALIGLLLNVGMEYGIATDVVGEVYGKIKNSLESINPLF